MISRFSYRTSFSGFGLGFDSSLEVSSSRSLVFSEKFCGAWQEKSRERCFLDPPSPQELRRAGHGSAFANQAFAQSYGVTGCRDFTDDR